MFSRFDFFQKLGRKIYYFMWKIFICIWYWTWNHKETNYWGLYSYHSFTFFLLLNWTNFSKNISKLSLDKILPFATPTKLIDLRTVILVHQQVGILLIFHSKLFILYIFRIHGWLPGVLILINFSSFFLTFRTLKMDSKFLDSKMQMNKMVMLIGCRSLKVSLTLLFFNLYSILTFHLLLRMVQFIFIPS